MPCGDGCATLSTAAAAGRDDPRFRGVLWVALVANGSMFAVETVSALISGSVSLQADALDFLGDAASYAITLLVLGMSLRARAGAALLKGATMATFGLWVIGSAAQRAYTGGAPDPAVMGAVGLLALAVNLGVAALLYRYRGGDSNARSIWLCSRNDAIGNIAVILAAGGVVATATGWPDILVAAIVAALNLAAAASVIRQAIAELRSDARARIVAARAIGQPAG